MKDFKTILNESSGAIDTGDFVLWLKENNGKKVWMHLSSGGMLLAVIKGKLLKSRNALADFSVGSGKAVIYNPFIGFKVYKVVYDGKEAYSFTTSEDITYTIGLS